MVGTKEPDAGPLNFRFFAERKAVRGVERQAGEIRYMREPTNRSRREVPLKRSILILLLAGLIGLAACGTELTPTQLTMAVQTLTASAYTPTPTSTPDPDESAIVILLNRGLAETVDPLSQTIDARYQVVDASFPPGVDGKSTTFRIDVRCECASAAACCTVERTFIAVTAAMKTGAEKIARQVPNSVDSLQVACFDHATQTGMMVASWQDMVSYFTGAINGFQLGARVVKLAGP